MQASLCPECLTEFGLMETVAIVARPANWESVRGGLVINRDGSEGARAASYFSFYKEG